MDIRVRIAGRREEMISTVYPCCGKEGLSHVLDSKRLICAICVLKGILLVYLEKFNLVSILVVSLYYAICLLHWGSSSAQHRISQARMCYCPESAPLERNGHYAVIIISAFVNPIE
jgi:hypothetical protein